MGVRTGAFAPILFNENSRDDSWKDCNHSSHYQDNDSGSHTGTGSAGDAKGGGLPLFKAPKHPQLEPFFPERLTNVS
jgi:hypothetical protein